MDVKKEREKAGLTQEELAQKAGIPRDRISKWEQGKGKPKAEDFVNLQRIFGNKVPEYVPRNTKSQKITQKSAIHAGSNIPENESENSFLHAIITLTESNKGLVDSNRTVVETNQVIANTNKVLALKLINQPTEDVPVEIPSDELATIVALRGLVIEMYADLKKTTLEEAEAVLGTKAVAAKKAVGKTGIPSDAGK